ncbi:cytochrome c biogenesis CcdA family protein [Geobacter pelophilus]|uniref:Cytochrome c biogenesis CcdA family protein n=1 Tax=Geoanaerobacter pelophilus TaxID=60036 RepID=A0AAW4LDD6_9BACT|nr:cytochrome c biogenesis CcdA family protein [Geoanaerobacter pelophilus]MBT0666441.1 cytochrome c biogenesis CcdA family protein [Geoanaerobacter pelophilus]
MIELGISSILLAVGAGLASVMSPCVLPVVPIIMAGAERKDRLRPMILVMGLSLSFMIMGAISSLFGAMLVGRTRYIEIAGSIVIIALGLMVIFDISIFKRITALSNLHVKGEGRLGAFVLGMALGLVWVPCVGPFLSSILTMVGTNGQLTYGITLLGFYSMGLAVPMLILAYSSHLLQSRIKALARHDKVFRYASGAILVGFGLYAVVIGNFAF